jgi:hypothetical protein
MQTTNFIDPITKEEFYISKHRTIHRDGEWINVDNSGEELVNPKSGNKLICIPKDGVPTILQGNRKEQLTKMLKKRSSDHFKKEIKEAKHEMNKKLNDKK